MNITYYQPIVVMLIGVCLSSPAKAQASKQQPPAHTYLDQGWSSQDRHRFYTTTQGSRMIPYSWFIHLEQPDSERMFSDPALLEAEFGYLFPIDAPTDSVRLPIGFTLDEEPDRAKAYALKLPALERGLSSSAFDRALSEVGPEAKLTRAADQLLASPDSLIAPAPRRLAPLNEAPQPGDFPQTDTWIGLSCAACHTTEIRHGGRILRIDGGPALADFTPFSERLVAALNATLEDPAKFARFARRVLRNPTPEAVQTLRQSVTNYSQGFAGLVARSQSPTPYGPGRLDAFGILINEIVGTSMKQPENYRVPNAPTSYPALWGAPNFDWVQWNGASHSPLARNIGEVLGVFADLDLAPGSPTIFQTSAHITNLNRLENWLKTLKPPPWPEAVLGPLDSARRDRGSLLYREQKCIDCHALPPGVPDAGNLFGRKLVRTQRVPLQVVKTDPTSSMNFLTRTAKPGIFAAALGGQPEVPVALLLGTAVRVVMKREFERLGLTAAERLEFLDEREDLRPEARDLAGYKARDLGGIWATAPYLHNGSVPTLHDLLLPPADRAVTFRLGSREFDPLKVGFVTDQGRFDFDTRLPSNSNQGHEFGTSLTDEQRLDLIEFLKSL